ncbi:uncharacterized protein BDZ99DRAFT_479483 [Mytilinidion resinicola]|uniref:Uncharacterized protein n=1 Tax=Mytilinidion resinicola TaxID=574789 RepID=A0A6A6YED3_9PEZI|nr:uncharacterized protein BDZ99DRAFT_479483 [Mytilinidion resinicola]KAF2806207.1 hypothetical protein BDZ99DRAFT_479483 [Mytilinidion resinicola]
MSTATTLIRSVITPAPRQAPELLRRQSGLYGPLLGYYNSVYGDTSSWQALTCDSDQVFSTSNVFAGCVESSSIGLPMLVDCLQTQISVVSISGTTLMCSNCVKQTIYETTPAAGTAYYNYFCAEGYSALTIFRETQGISSSFSSTSTNTTPASTSALSIPPTATPTTSTTPSPSSQPTQSKTNQAWIAGPALGAAAFVVACIALGFVVYTRRRRPKPYEHSEYTAAQQSPSEIDGRSVPAEMGMR